MKGKEISRRGFLNIALAAGGAIAIGETLFVGLRFLAPKATDGAFGGEFNLGAYDQFPLASVTPVEAGRVYLVRLQDGGFLAVYRRCTHLGCSVPYDPSIQQFVCPCHGSEFTMEGDVLTAPAPRPLDIFPLSITDTGEVVINTRNPIERGQTDPAQIVYA
jgi:cytochrome b6-f complex iron-sulfur subunit